MMRGLLTLVILSALSAADAGETTYEADVRPILKAHCFQCHGEEALEGSLDLRLRRFIAGGGESGPAIVPGDVEGSLLIQRVSSGEMPPDDDKLLSAEEVAVLMRWVADGAPTARRNRSRSIRGRTSPRKRETGGRFDRFKGRSRRRVSRESKLPSMRLFCQDWRRRLIRIPGKPVRSDSRQSPIATC